MTADPFDVLAALPGVVDRVGCPPDGQLERYLYSDDYLYRYAFGRWWGKAVAGRVRGVGAAEPGDRRHRAAPSSDLEALHRLVAGHAGIVIANLFAFRATDPRALRTAHDPVGPANDTALAMFTAAGAQTLVAWGSHCRLHGRSRAVAPLLEAPMCLGTARHGEPRHPLYVPRTTALVPWSPPSTVR